VPKNVEKYFYDYFLNLRYIALKAYLLQITKARQGKRGKQAEEIISQINHLLLEKKQSWDNALRAQQLLTQIYNKSALDVEFNKLLIQTKGVLSEQSATFYGEAAQDADQEKRRILLKDLIVDVELEKSTANLERVFARKMRIQTSIIFIVSILIFVAAITLFNLNILGVDWSAYEAAGLAMAAGVMGSAFSQLTGLKGRIENATLEELMHMSNYSSMLTRIIIGLGAALILVFFFQGNLLSGTFFPKFEFENGTLLPLMATNRALLLVWSVIAGFSEKLVPSILTTTAESVSVKSNENDEAAAQVEG